MSVITKCDICGREPHNVPYSLNRQTFLGNNKVFDVCEDCVEKLKEMRKNECKKSNQHS